MSEVKYCFENDEIGDLAQNMGDEQIRRLPVLNDKNRVVVSFRSAIWPRAEMAVRRRYPTSLSLRASRVTLSDISKAGSHHCAILSDSEKIGTVEAASADVAIKEQCGQ